MTAATSRPPEIRHGLTTVEDDLVAALTRLLDAAIDFDNGKWPVLHDRLQVAAQLLRDLDGAL